MISEREIMEKIMMDCIGPRWGEMAEISIKTLRGPSEKVPNTLDAQILYVQRRIRWHEQDIAKVMGSGLSDSECETALRHFGLRPDLVSLPLVLECLEDLKNEQLEQLERRFGELLVYMAFSPVAEYDQHSVSVEEQASELGLALIAPNTERAQYVGQMVAEDNNFGLIVDVRERAIKFFFWDMADGQRRPKIGDLVQLKFKKGALLVTVAEKTYGRHSRSKTQQTL